MANGVESLRVQSSPLYRGGCNKEWFVSWQTKTARTRSVVHFKTKGLKSVKPGTARAKLEMMSPRRDALIEHANQRKEL